MLELTTSYSFSQIPYITYEALDAYAEDVLREAMPDALNTPAAINAERFVEFYLGLQIELKRLRYNRQILGMTAFNAGYVQILDDLTGNTEPMFVSAGTVIIEPPLTLKRNIQRCRLTYLH